MEQMGWTCMEKPKPNRETPLGRPMKNTVEICRKKGCRNVKWVKSEEFSNEKREPMI